MKRQRDIQRSAVYAAEDMAFDKNKDAEFETLAECNDFAKRIICSEYWLKNKGLKRFSLSDGRGRRSACFKGIEHGYRRNTICLPKWSRSRWVIIHEFAHFLTMRTDGKYKAWHGATFCRHYVELILEMIGQEECNKLETCFREKSVKVLPV